MTHVITQNCCNDAACVAACPVDCIHPRPDDPDFATAEMLYIDPAVCIDCGACVTPCPVDAIKPLADLGEAHARYADINAFLAAERPAHARPLRTEPLLKPRLGAPLRVAIVGAGPAGLYAADELLTLRGAGVEVDVFDRLPTPWGLMRAGVAPDHAATKSAADRFRFTTRRPGFRYHLNVEVGRDITHAELVEHFHAVIYTVGAMSDRRLGIPGEDLPGSHAATEFVGWYNGHPDFADRAFDLSGERAVIIGNGNVALDVARILVSDPERLARTDIADHALEALRNSGIREVVVIGRRGPAQAAYTGPEVEALGRLAGVDVIAEFDGVVPADATPQQRLKTSLSADFVGRPTTPGHRRIVLRYLQSPTEILGSNRVEGVRLVHNALTTGPDGQAVATPTDGVETLDAQLVLRSVGYRGSAVPGVPFDEARGTIANDGGRVLGEDGVPLAGTYTAGWIKRGPSGVIGTNKQCAAETVDRLLTDAGAGRLTAPIRGRLSLDRLLAERQSAGIDAAGWDAIDRHEREAGALAGRPRVKVVDTDAMVRIARSN